MARLCSSDRTVSKKNIPPDDCWDKYLPHKPQEDVDQDGDFEHFMSVKDYELLFNGNNSLSECAKKHHRALNDEDVSLPDILFFPILQLN